MKLFGDDLQDRRGGRPPKGNRHLRYEVNGDVATIYIESKARGTQKVLVDAEDLDHVLDHPYSWCCNKQVTKSRVWYYVLCAGRCKNGKQGPMVLLHRFLLGLTNSAAEVDHINGNDLDNRRANLRVTTHVGNCLNKIGLRSDNTSGTVGVYFDKRCGKWVAQISENGKRTYLGVFGTKAEAIAVVEKRRAELIQFHVDITELP